MPVNELDIRVYSKRHKKYLDKIILISFYARFVTGTIDDIPVDVEFEDVIFERSTNTIDIKGNKVYTGDILLYSNNEDRKEDEYYLVFNAGAACMLKTKTGYEFIDNDFVSLCQVIGHIH